MTEYKIALVGFGGVNRGLAQLIADRNAEWKASLGFGIKIVGVTDIFFLVPSLLKRGWMQSSWSLCLSRRGRSLICLEAPLRR